MARLKRTLGCLMVVAVVYVLYATLAVPWLEPSVQLAPDSDIESAPAEDSPTRGFEWLFAAGSWELERPKVLETDQGTLIFDDYQTLPDNRMQLNRCTLIFQLGQQSGGRPLVLRAEQGAVLNFEGDLNIPRGQFGRLSGGELIGPIIMFSPPSSAADDGLEIRTRDVQIEERRIWTPHEVTFRYGQNSGAGADLSILLHPPSKLSGGEQSDSGLGRVRSLEMVRVEQFNLQLPGNKLSLEEPDADAASQSTPVEIRCRGPLRYDVDVDVLSLSDHVDVVRHNVDGPSDQLNCQQLLVHFQSDWKAVGDKTRDGDAELKVETRRFQPSKLVALGFPVVVRADSIGATARGERLEYDVEKRRLWMQDSQQLMLRDEQYEVRTSELEYEVAEAGRLGRLWAAGPGRVTGRMGDKQQSFEATWQGEVRLQPFQGAKVLSLVDGTHIQFEAAGELFADELHLFLVEEARSSQDPRVTARPDRMKAVGHVRFDSPQLVGSLHEANLWFIKPSPAAAGEATSRPAQQSLFAVQPDSTENRTRKLNVSARQLNAEIELDNPPKLLNLRAIHSVHAEEPGIETPQGISLDCEEFQVLGASGPEPVATLVGHPARVQAQGALLTGAQIDIYQRQNLAEIQGAGEMLLPMKQSPQYPLRVVWRHSLRFDGQVAHLTGNVETRGVQFMQSGEQVHFHARGESLTARLSNYVDFQRPRQPEGVGLQELIFGGQCSLTSETLAGPNQRKSLERAELLNLRLDQASGELHGDGPGWLTSVHPGQDIFKEGQAPELNRGLRFLRIDFQRELVGNLHGKQMEFLGNVRSVYGPVERWDQTINTADPSRLGPRDVVVTSQRLALADLGQSRERFDGVELEATGNAFVRGQTFTASGQRVSYARAKDQLILEGDGRNYAELSYQLTPGAAPAPLRAGKILFWPDTKQFELDGFHSLEVQDLSQLRSPRR